MTSSDVMELVNNTKIRVGRSWEGYRPYSFTTVVNGKTAKYEVHRIKFYNENGIIFTTRSGWLEALHQTVTKENLFNYLLEEDKRAIYLNNLNRRAKENFNNKDNFFIPVKREYASDNKKADLYIYVDNVNIKVERTLTDTRQEECGTTVSDCTKIVRTITGLTDEPFQMLSTIYSNQRQSDIGKLVEDFKNKNTSYPLNNISDYALAELFRKYTLVEK